MKTLWRRMRAALGLGLTWGLAWGLIGGFVMEAFVDPHGRIADMWPQGLAMTGFLGGVIFSIVLWMTEGRRSFHQLSLPRVGLWGAVAGTLLVGAGLAIGLQPSIAALVLGPVALLSAGSATGSLALARRASEWQLVGAGERKSDKQLE